MLGISEIRWTGQGQTTNNGVTILYSERENAHTHGIGILLSRKATDALRPPLKNLFSSWKVQMS